MNQMANMRSITKKIISSTEIPCKKTSMTFDKSVYREDYLQGIIEKEEFNKIIDECSKILGKAAEKKRENDEIKLPKFIIWLTVISVLLSILYIAAIFISLQYKSLSTAFFIIGILCITSAAVIAVSLSLFNFFRTIKKFKTLETFIKEDLEFYLDSINPKFIGKCEFRYLAHREQVMEIVTFVKTGKMLEEEMLDNKKTMVFQKDTTRIQEDEDRKSQNMEDKTLFKLDDDSKAGLKRSNSNDKQEVEMAILSEKDKNEKPKKKFGGIKKKQN
jgi:hypothetical protein